MKKLNSSVTDFCISLLIILTLAFAFISFQWALASMWYFNASYHIDEWSRSELVDNRRDYDDALLAINKAISYSSENPHYLHTKGKIIHWGIISKFEKQHKIKEIKEIYKTSLIYRESWPIVWSDLARINSLIEGLSIETQSYIDKALFYGPYKKEVILEVFDIYMQNLSDLNSTQTLLFYKLLESFTNHPHLLKNILINAEEYGVAHIICIQIKFNQKYKSLSSSWVKNEYCK
ncbi:VpsP family polysaccharide biosynthesis protein [Pseudoalteromonas sp. C2R02]|uniref:VpsP family polysaccharide biosynthesis protein n=1 Tax=Pseudoalteromonas sp. C2R02 TaxID=2841565 RepID=UPI001C09A830|nr:VpsP family polysaccharide biosynthesis protein [Pseudoalteromonas sp. C2R02]MBU2969567.1 VpsP family polysaccharide biosynthesis protein [Pseudoalteromonas sp. C2R02]